MAVQLDRIPLRQALAQHFSLYELKFLCNDAGIDPETVPYSERGREVYAYCIVEVFRRKDLLPSLLRECTKARPGIDWLELSIENTMPADWATWLTPQLINTAGGSYIAGGVTTGGGDFVGRDKHVTINHVLSANEIQDQENRRTLGRMVKSFWIDGVLSHSLNHEVAIRLNIAERLGAVDNHPWKIVVQRQGVPDRMLPPSARISEIFREMNQRMLILGEPGSGKTTTLLELARDLLEQAPATPTSHTPIVLNLSSWAERRQPMADWLVDELNIRYRIPKDMARNWVEKDRLLLLLDGLDEVQSQHRGACVQAINYFLQNHLVPIVVCSRVGEYESLTVRLRLQGAVLIQPLTFEQIDAYMNQAGESLAAVRAILQNDAEFQELAQSPLMLSIMSLAYQGNTSSDLSLSNSTQSRKQHLFDAYIRHMFTHREVKHVYSPNRIIRWLAWLAKRLLSNGQTVFLIEQMQPSWLESAKHRLSLSPRIMVLWGPLYGLIGGLILGLNYGLLAVFLRSGGQDADVSGVMLFGLIVGLIVGLTAGLSDWLTGKSKQIMFADRQGRRARRLRSSIYCALLYGLIVGLPVGRNGDITGGLFGGLIGGLFGGLIGGFREVKLVQMTSISWRKLLENLRFGLLNGLLFGLYFFLVVSLMGLIVWLVSRSVDYLANAFLFGSIGGAIFSILGGLVGGLLFEPDKKLDILSTDVTQSHTQRIKTSARFALGTALWFFAIFGLIAAMVVEQIVGLTAGLTAGIVIGMLGGFLGGLLGGVDTVIKHYLLRIVLWSKGHIPARYARFLDHCVALIFLRRVGGGYIFIHRTFMEFFGELTENDIDRMASSIRNV